MIRSTVALRVHRLAFCPTVLLFLLTWGIQLDAAEFYCPSGNVTCLIASINEANTLPGQHIISLEPGIYTLRSVEDSTDGNNGLPSIKRSISIKASMEDSTTVIERDAEAALFFRIIHVSAGGELLLDGITIQRGAPLFGGGAAIWNGGVTILNNAIVSANRGESGTIHNRATLTVSNSIIADNDGAHDGGGIVNEGGDVVIEHSTLARNHGIGPGGIANYRGSLIVTNSALIANITDNVQPGGGIGNFEGSVEIVNTTIAKNIGGILGAGGVHNSGGTVIIANSTIRENQTRSGFVGGGGIRNDGGVMRLQNTILAGNSLFGFGLPSTGPDCSGNISTRGNNLFGDLSGCDVNLQASDMVEDPGLGPLVETGEDDLPGKAFYPVLMGSPVINRGNPTACPSIDQLGNPRLGACDIGAVEFQGKLLVSTDIRPRSDANKINPNSKGNINVAVFSGDGFDAATLDPSTIRFGAKGGEASPVNLSLRDVDGDGERDMLLRFEIQNTGIECGDTSATLTGEVSGGQSFIGSARITTTGCKPPKTKHVS